MGVACEKKADQTRHCLCAARIGTLLFNLKKFALSQLMYKTWRLCYEDIKISQGDERGREESGEWGREEWRVR